MPLPVELNRMCEEVLDLLDEQLAVIRGRELEDFSEKDLVEFGRRKLRVAELRGEVEKFVAAKSN